MSVATAPAERLAPLDQHPALVRWIHEAQVHSHFQPIGDLFSGNTLAYEILTQGDPPFTSAQGLFEAARAAGMLWEVECLCREKAFKQIAAFPADLRGATYFLNVSPWVLRDPRFAGGFTVQVLRKYGLSQSQIVIELTEQMSVGDYTELERLVRHYVQQGFRISLEDFGAGHSGLATLIAVSPYYLKLSQELVREIHRHAYKQLLVKSMVSFAESVEARLVAAGVESWEELEAIQRLGVRFAQGDLLAHPQPSPPALSPSRRQQILQITRSFNYARVELEEAIDHLVIRRPTFLQGSRTCEAVDLFLKRNPGTDHIVITDSHDRPLGLITRQHFYAQTGGPFGYPLFQRKRMEAVAKRDLLMVEAGICVTRLAKLAMEREPADTYDPVIVVDRSGGLLGTVTMKQLIGRNAELEVRAAMDANPLTSLPGNRFIQRWIQECLHGTCFAIVYADLNRFKEYNDIYGFLMGDEMLRLQAGILRKHATALHRDARLGHVGGDDFVIVCPAGVEPEPLQTICHAFDQARCELFTPAHLGQGYYLATDRKGEEARVPLVSLSLAAINSDSLTVEPHPALLSQIAASLKKKIKESTALTGRSGFFLERRRYRPGEEPAPTAPSPGPATPASLLPGPDRQGAHPPGAAAPVSPTEL